VTATSTTAVSTLAPITSSSSSSVPSSGPTRVRGAREAADAGLEVWTHRHMGNGVDQRDALRSLLGSHTRNFMQASQRSVQDVCRLVRESVPSGADGCQALLEVLATRLAELDQEATSGTLAFSSSQRSDKDEKEEPVVFRRGDRDDDGSDDDDDDGGDGVLAVAASDHPQREEAKPAARSGHEGTASQSGVRLSSAPAASSTQPQRVSSRLSQSQSTLPPSTVADWQGAGVTEQEWHLCNMLVTNPRISPVIKASLTDAGRALLRALRSQHNEAAVPFSASAAAALPPPQLSSPTSVRQAPVGAAPSSSRGRASSALAVAASLPGYPAQAAAAAAPSSLPLSGPGSMPHFRWQQPPAGQHDDESGSDPGEQPVSPALAATSAASISSALLRLGVPDSLAHDNIYRQACDLVGPRGTFITYWTALFNGPGDRRDPRTFYEGQVLSMLLDNVHDLDFVGEVAARRWMTLHSVASGGQWAASEAILPLSAAPGFTARQQAAMQRYGRAADRAPQRPFGNFSRSRSGGSGSRARGGAPAGAGDAGDIQPTRRRGYGARRGGYNGNAGARRQRSGSRGAGARSRGSASGAEEQ
jgi:hypothetical protein